MLHRCVLSLWHSTLCFSFYRQVAGQVSVHQPYKTSIIISSDVRILGVLTYKGCDFGSESSIQGRVQPLGIPGTDPLDAKSENFYSRTPWIYDYKENMTAVHLSWVWWIQWNELTLSSTHFTFYWFSSTLFSFLMYDEHDEMNLTFYVHDLNQQN